MKENIHRNIHGLPSLLTINIKDVAVGDFFATGLYCYLKLPDEEEKIRALNLVNLSVWSYSSSTTHKCIPIDGSIQINSHPWASHIIKQDTPQ